MSRTRIIIIGAAGRDFHNFNTMYRGNADYEVVAFTATQIPDIADRRYPAELAGELYPEGIPIHDMSELEAVIRSYKAEVCVFSYSDISYNDLMQIGTRVMVAGAHFMTPTPHAAYLESTKPVISVLAVRTGSGKSQTSRRVVEILKNDLGVTRVVSIRHPMPYGDLKKQAVQRFAKIQDLQDFECTIEEMEEYEPHIAAGNVIYAGVDYERILRQAEAEADVILWDGGNNDPSFIRSDLTIVVADPLRPGHELTYYSGETNITMADVVVLNKCDSAKPEDIETVEHNIRSRNAKAQILRADSPVTVDHPELVTGKRVLVVEDGPTLTHGNMSIGAGYVAAKQLGASEIIRAKEFAVGSVREAYDNYPQITEVLPALGYFQQQLDDLAQSIRNAKPDTVIIGTPIDLRRVIKIECDSTRVQYDLKEHDPGKLRDAIAGVLRKSQNT
ncbi:MAG: cyclic 2,3-diphosphoglycerate synthase [bacterium]|nr:cyclic 2,3-diphosphoglycerate synthase [bacterium]